MFSKSAKTNLPSGFNDIAELEAWLVAEVARRMRVPVEQLSTSEPLVGLGLDSRTAVAISGDLEKIFRRELSPTLVWDYPTITALAHFLMASAPPAEAGATP